MFVYQPGSRFNVAELLDGLLLLPPLDIAVVHQNSRRRVYSLGVLGPRPRERRRARWHVRIVVPSDTSAEVAEHIEDILVGNIETVNWDARSASRVASRGETTDLVPAGR